jgi:hypothetical protein
MLIAGCVNALPCGENFSAWNEILKNGVITLSYGVKISLQASKFLLHGRNLLYRERNESYNTTGGVLWR